MFLLNGKSFLINKIKNYKYTDYCETISANGRAEKVAEQFLPEGLDCSGFVGWAVYNVINKDDTGKSLVCKSFKQPEFLAKDCNLGDYTDYQNVKSVKPGDILAIKKGHVYISLGQCKDGSVLIIDSSPPGIQIRGTKNDVESDKSEAVDLAKKYMSRYYPEWYEKFPDCVSKSADYRQDSKFSWDISAKGAMSDPEKYRDFTTKEVLKDLFSEL